MVGQSINIFGSKPLNSAGTTLILTEREMHKLVPPRNLSDGRLQEWVLAKPETQLIPYLKTASWSYITLATHYRYVYHESIILCGFGSLGQNVLNHLDVT